MSARLITTLGVETQIRGRFGWHHHTSQPQPRHAPSKDKSMVSIVILGLMTPIVQSNLLALLQVLVQPSSPLRQLIQISSTSIPNGHGWARPQVWLASLLHWALEPSCLSATT